MPVITLSSKHQITVPKAIRQRLNLRQGSKVTFIAGEKGAILVPYPNKWASYGWGLGKEIWNEIDPLEYIRQERSSWKK